MLVIEGKPFLEHQINLLKKNEIEDIVLCVGYKAEQIKDYFGDGKKFGVKIEYSQERKELLGTGGALKKAENLLGNDFLVMYGDSYLPFNFQEAIESFRKFDKFDLMVTYRNLNRYEPSNVAVEKGLVKSYSKKRKTKEMKYIDYGVGIFEKEALKILPENTPCDLSQLYQPLIKRNQLLAFKSKTRFYTIGSFRELEEFKKYIKKVHNF